MIIAVCSAFNEAPVIERAILSVYDLVDVFLLADGAYKEYEHDQPWSTDGMLDIAKRYAKVKLMEVNQAWPDQCAKRTAMFIGQVGDYYLRIDADEELVSGDIPPLTFDVGLGLMSSNIYPQPYIKPILFRHQEGMHYAGKHHWLYNSQNELITSDQNQGNAQVITTNLRLYNHRQDRSPQRNRQKWQLIQTRQERLVKNETEVYGKKQDLIPYPDRAGKPVDTFQVIKISDQVNYSFVTMVSRPWAVVKYFDMIKELDLPHHTEFICVIDGEQHLADLVLSQLPHIWHKFSSIKILITHVPKPAEFSDVASRRRRVINNYRRILTEVRGQYILGSEDDTLVPPAGYIKLLKHLNKKVKFAQGTEVNRWNCPIYSAWHITDHHEKPAVVLSGVYKNTGTEAINGVGFYCFAAETSILRKVELKTDGLLPLGPDLRMGYELTKMGYTCLHDWEVKCIHFGEDFELICGEKSEIRRWVKVGGQWRASRVWE